MDNSNQILCKAGCGFFGNPETDELCSVCYKKNKQRTTPAVMKEVEPIITPSLVTDALPIATTSSSANEEASNATALSKNDESIDDSDKSDASLKKKKNRCGVCRKKIGLLPIQCRCGGIFCGLHRYSDKHDCSFDYQAMAVKEIKQNNPVVVSEKIEKL